MRNYTHTRVRGLASWQPRGKTLLLIEQVCEVLDEYADSLPLTVRQVFYRLVAAHDYPKDERAYARLGEMLVRARRAGVIPFAALRDDGAVIAGSPGFHGKPDFLAAVRAAAEAYGRNRLEGQAASVELWVEAGGMVPQLERVADPLGVLVYSSGGFDSLTVKYDAARRFAERARPSVVLHVGDFDPSGLSIFDSVSEDVDAMVADLGAVDSVEFRRVAVTEEQIERYNLATSPAKTTDRRGGWEGRTVQAEALAPDELAAEVRRALERELDADVLDRLLAVEAQERRQLVEMFSALELVE